MNLRVVELQNSQHEAEQMPQTPQQWQICDLRSLQKGPCTVLTSWLLDLCQQRVKIRARCSHMARSLETELGSESRNESGRLETEFMR